MPRYVLSRFARHRGPVDIGFVIGACALVFVGLLSYRNNRELRNEAGWIRHTDRVLHLLPDIDESFAPAMASDRKLKLLIAKVDTLQTLTADNPWHQQRIDTLRNLMVARKQVDFDSLIRRMQFAERDLLAQRSARTESRVIQTTRIITGSIMLAVLLMATALALLHHDLERRKQAEDKLVKSEAEHRALMEQAADAILIVDSRAVCVDANARAAALIGRSIEELPGVPLTSFVEGTLAGTPAVLPMLHFGQVTKGEFWVVRPNGSRVPVEIHATLLEDGRVQIIARDITERKEVERMKDEFVSLVSHELRTPLTSIRGAIGLLASGRLAQDPAKQHRMLDLAAVNTDRLIRLINDILDVERINSGAVAFERTAANARELVESCVEALRPIAERSGVSVQWSCAEMRIWADPDRIIQTLTNLIGNAIKFSPPGSTVYVSGRRDGTIALFEVRDQGRGIPQEKLATVFDRFQQVDASDSREKGGTGLGLAISRGIVEQHGGRIWAESTLGEGSAFSFTVPLFPGDIAGPAYQARRSVLICDDDEDLVEVLSATLAARGCTAIGVHSGREAIARFDASPSEVVIVDLMLPDISGRDVIRHIHSTAPKTCIIVYSAAYIPDADREAIRNTRARIITKGRTTIEQVANEVALLVDRTSTPTESVA